ncbi:MAG: hypothetical protein PHX70_14375 [Clostridium sp.]|nr:hypothetical protein [Clostridium sp.]
MHDYERMKNNLKTLITMSEKISDLSKDYEIDKCIEELRDKIKDIIYSFMDTINCPSNWRDIGEKLAQDFKDKNYIMENYELWNFYNEEEE